MGNVMRERRALQIAELAVNDALDHALCVAKASRPKHALHLAIEVAPQLL